MCQRKASLIHDDRVVPAVKDKRWNSNQLQTIANIDGADCILETYCIMWRRADPHEFVHPSNLFGCAFGNEAACENLAECRIVLTPSVEHQSLESFMTSNAFQ